MHPFGRAPKGPTLAILGGGGFGHSPYEIGHFLLAEVFQDFPLPLVEPCQGHPLLNSRACLRILLIWPHEDV